MGSRATQISDPSDGFLKGVSYTFGHLASRSDRHGAPVLICPVRRPQRVLIQKSKTFRMTLSHTFEAECEKLRPTTKSAMKESSTPKIACRRNLLAPAPPRVLGSYLWVPKPKLKIFVSIRFHSYPTLQQELLNIHWLSTPAVLGFTRPMRDHDTPSGVLRHCCSLQCKICKRALDFKIFQANQAEFSDRATPWIQEVSQRSQTLQDSMRWNTTKQADKNSSTDCP